MEVRAELDSWAVWKSASLMDTSPVTRQPLNSRDMSARRCKEEMKRRNQATGVKLCFYSSNQSLSVFLLLTHYIVGLRFVSLYKMCMSKLYWLRVNDWNTLNNPSSLEKYASENVNLQFIFQGFTIVSSSSAPSWSSQVSLVCKDSFISDIIKELRVCRQQKRWSPPVLRLRKQAENTELHVLRAPQCSAVAGQNRYSAGRFEFYRTPRRSWLFCLQLTELWKFFIKT